MTCSQELDEESAYVVDFSGNDTSSRIDTEHSPHLVLVSSNIDIALAHALTLALALHPPSSSFPGNGTALHAAGNRHEAAG